jgi:hypothetical protein
LLEAALWSSGGRELGLGAVLPEEQRVCGGEEIKGREYASCFLFFFEGVVRVQCVLDLWRSADFSFLWEEMLLQQEIDK